MQKFHYKYIKTKNDNHAKFLFIEADDVYKGFYEYKNLLDFGDYLKHSKFFDSVKKII